MLTKLLLKFLTAVVNRADLLEYYLETPRSQAENDDLT
jgi:hypothetical protein